jgi:hypothetical protein
MRIMAAVAVVIMAAQVCAAATALPPLYDGVAVSGPGRFRHDGELLVTGHVTLRKLSLDLRGPVRLAAGATLELDGVDITVSDPRGTPNGTSNLRCDGPAHVMIRRSRMAPVGSAHPIWVLQGAVDVDDFQTENSEFHLDHAQAKLSNFRIFELEISRASQVTANHLRLVFLSTHSGEDDSIEFSGIPADTPFSADLKMGSGAKADLKDTRAHLFLIYLHGQSKLALSHMGRVQMAIFPRCQGSLVLRTGHVGTDEKPAVFPEPGASNCPFRISMNDVKLDTWDLYAGGEADLTLSDSLVDELTAGENAKITVRNSSLYADWLALSGEAQLRVENSTVGALRLAWQRPDLATSQLRLGGNSKAVFSQVRFDCGMFAADHAGVKIEDPVVAPKYVRTSGSATVETTPAAKKEN